jgi:hypothetical protein
LDLAIGKAACILRVLGKAGNILLDISLSNTKKPFSNTQKKNKPKPSNVYRSSSKARLDEEANTEQRKQYPIKLISYLKCHYCNLDFHDVKERREHELAFHV